MVWTGTTTPERTAPSRRANGVTWRWWTTTHCHRRRNANESLRSRRAKGGRDRRAASFPSRAGARGQDGREDRLRGAVPHRQRDPAMGRAQPPPVLDAMNNDQKAAARFFLRVEQEEAGGGFLVVVHSVQN